MGRTALLTLLIASAASSWSCRRAARAGMTPADADGAGAERSDRSRFRLSLLARDGEVAPQKTALVCASSVRGSDPPPGQWLPEAGFVAALSVRGDRRTVTGDDRGIGAIVGLESGFQVLEIASTDGRLRGKVPLELEARRTEIVGWITPDSDDADDDENTREWRLTLDIIPDDESDRVSDNGTHERWSFDPEGGVGFRHRRGTTSERVRLDAELVERDALAFPDRDGDFIADAEDSDADGDARLDAEEPGALPCPGFSHDTLFAQRSKHKKFDCERCHRLEDPGPLACEDCHAALGRAFAETPLDRPPDHFARRCEQCHVADRPWAEVPGPGGERHEPFPLAGKHLETSCFRCHVTGDPKPARLCETCHISDAGVDHHKTSCEACHGPSGWLPPEGVSHEQFPLRGGHANAPCNACHTGTMYSGLSKACVSCHADDAPEKHVAAGFSLQPCEGCHVLARWSDYRYNHDIWLLAGTHRAIPCSDCHAGSRTGYTGNDRACVSCHEAPSFPNHAAFGPDCDACHGEAGFVPATTSSIDHSVWPLQGSHRTSPCGGCHQGGAVARPSRDCTGCHAPDRPVRHAGYFDGDCAGCHQPTTWTSLLAPYTHTPAFALDGVHAAQACSRCHATTYTASPLCIDCHASDEPANHYGRNCRDCHDTASWNPGGAVNHHTADPNAFPLTLAHSTLLCSRCHAGGFRAIPESCESCHLNDTPAGHALDACSRCHDSGTWQNANPPPPSAYHPLRGGHTGRTCVSCHGTYRVGMGFQNPRPNTACISCHSLPQGHIPVGTSDCTGCHSANTWIPATGGHEGPLPSATFPYPGWTSAWFPDAGHHGANQCNKCHTMTSERGYAFFSCTTGCHQRLLDGSKHDHGIDSGQHLFHLFHFSPLDANVPPNEGGAVWPTGHVGCVKSGCHPTGRN